MQRLASNLGFSVGPAAGGFLASRHFWLLFVVVALTTLIAAIALLWFFRLRRIEGATDENVNVEVRTSPLLDKTFVYFLALMLMSMLVFFQFLPTYPLYLQDHYGLSTELIGLMFAINTVVIVVFEMLLVDHVKHWPLLPTIGWGSFLTCVGFGIFPFGTSIAFGALAMLVVTVREMLSVPLAVSFVASRSPAGQEGSYMGWYTMTHSIAWVLGPTLGSAIYSINREAVWYTSLGIGVVVLVEFYAMGAGVKETAKPQAAD